MSTLITSETQIAEVCRNYRSPVARAIIETALLILYSRQTPTERANKMTSEHNGMGFGQKHALQGTRAAERIALGLLSGKRIGTIIDDVPSGCFDADGSPVTFLQLAGRCVYFHRKQVIRAFAEFGSFDDVCAACDLDTMARKAIGYYASKGLPVGFAISGYLESK